MIGRPDIVIAVDPGGTTGLCTFFPNVGVVEVGRQLKPMEACEYVDDMVSTEWSTLVLVERFTITSATVTMSRQDDALKIIGAIEYMCHRVSDTMELQSPPTAKKICKDPRLKSLGIYVPGRGHANDAARHLVLGIERNLTSLLDSGQLTGYNSGPVRIERM